MNDSSQDYNKYVKLQSQYSAHLRLRGKVNTQRLYEWLKAGDIVQVLEDDASFFLSMRRGKGSCCGGNPQGNSVFLLVE